MRERPLCPLAAAMALGGARAKAAAAAAAARTAVNSQTCQLRALLPASSQWLPFFEQFVRQIGIRIDTEIMCEHPKFKPDDVMPRQAHMPADSSLRLAVDTPGNESQYRMEMRCARYLRAATNVFTEECMRLVSFAGDASDVAGHSW